MSPPEWSATKHGRAASLCSWAALFRNWLSVAVVEPKQTSSIGPTGSGAGMRSSSARAGPSGTPSGSWAGLLNPLLRLMWCNSDLAHTSFVRPDLGPEMRGLPGRPLDGFSDVAGANLLRVLKHAFSEVEDAKRLHSGKNAC